FHTRDLRDGAGKLVKRRADLIWSFLDQRRRQGQIESKDVMGIKSWIDPPKARQTANRQSSADQQHDRQRHLHHNENCLRAWARATGAAPTFLQRFVQVLMGSLERGRESEKHTRKNRYNQREEQNARIHAHAVCSRKRLRQNLQRGLRSPECKEQ